jgi:hypothetical protein
LDSPLSHFFGVPEVMVKAVELIRQDAVNTAAAAAAAGPASLSTAQTAASGTPQYGAAGAVGDAAAARSAAPLAGTAAAEAAGASSIRPWDNPGKQHSFANYRSAPTCPFPPSKSNSVADSQGRFWSWNWGTECVFRAPAAGQNDKPVKVDWDTAVTCDEAPNERNSVVDDNGRLWGWQNDASCAFRSWGKGSSSSTTAATPGAPDGAANARMPMKQQQAPKNPAASFKDMQDDLPTRVSVVWESAPTCSFAPSDGNAVPDTFGRLWGWQNNSSCAFRVSYNSWCSF